jgi:hypothetical protein
VNVAPPSSSMDRKRNLYTDPFQLRLTCAICVGDPVNATLHTSNSSPLVIVSVFGSMWNRNRISSDAGAVWSTCPYLAVVSSMKMLSP